MDQSNHKGSLTDVQKIWSRKLAKEIADVIIKDKPDFGVTAAALITVITVIIACCESAEIREGIYLDFMENIQKAYNHTKDHGL